MEKSVKIAIKEFNIGLQTIAEYLKTQGIEIDLNPNTKLSLEHYNLLNNKFSDEKKIKEKAILLKENKSRLNEKAEINNNISPVEKLKRFEGIKKIVAAKKLKKKKVKKNKRSKKHVKNIEISDADRKKYKIESSGKSLYVIYTPMKG